MGRKKSNEWERKGIQLSFFLFLSSLAENAPGASAARLVYCEQETPWTMH